MNNQPATSERFDDDELELLAEALRCLREIKVDAHTHIVGVPGHEHLTPHDFGIPQIDRLLAKLEQAESRA
jgi:hypothetical protein